MALKKSCTCDPRLDGKKVNGYKCMYHMFLKALSIHLKTGKFSMEMNSYYNHSHNYIYECNQDIYRHISSWTILGLQFYGE